MQPLLRLPYAFALAVLAGVVMWLAFAPVALGGAAVVAIALLTAALWRASWRRGAGLGLVSGLVFFALLLSWMRVIGWDAWLLLTLLCGSWIALAGYATALVTRLPLAPVWVAAAWVGEEALRGRVPFGGFPWGEVAFAQADTSYGALAPVGGTAFVTFCVALVGASMPAIVVAVRGTRRATAAGWAVLAIALTVAPLLIRLPLTGDEVGGPTTAQIAIVQGGTPQFGMGAMDVRRAVLDNHVAQTLDLASAIDAGAVPRPAFVLWPENSSDIDPFADASVADAISNAARAVGVPIIVGAVISAPADLNGVWNVGIVWDPETGPQQMYIKNHPVPFGEYVPFRSVLASLIGRFDRVPNDFLAGDTPGNLDVNGVPVGNVICFEVAYRGVVDAVVSGGARVVTVQTNNATYGGTAQPAQQLAISRVRAMEFGRTVLVAATSGISAAIGPDGTLQQSINEGEAGWRVVETPLRGALTPATVIGHLMELLLVVIAASAVVVALVGATRRRRATRSTPVDQPIA